MPVFGFPPGGEWRGPITGSGPFAHSRVIAIKGQIMTDQIKQAPVDEQKIQGEGDYDAARRFDADEKAFVEKNREAIPGLAKAAEDALDGPEGEELRKAEAEGKAHSAE
jgi:hypothetical protein